MSIQDSHRARMQHALGNALVELHRAEEAASKLADPAAAKQDVEGIRAVRDALERVIDTISAR